MARRFASRPRFSRKPGSKVWIGFALGTTVLAASTSTLLGSLNAVALAFRPFTILRTHLELLYTSDQTGTSESPHGVLGLGVFNDTAAALGVTGLPAPSAQANAAWFAYQAVSHEFTFVSGVGFDGSSGTHYQVDSKSMRKVGQDQDIVVIGDQVNAVGSALTIQGRMLLQVH